MKKAIRTLLFALILTSVYSSMTGCTPSQSAEKPTSATETTETSKETLSTTEMTETPQETLAKTDNTETTEAEEAETQQAGFTETQIETYKRDLVELCNIEVNHGMVSDGNHINKNILDNLRALMQEKEIKKQTTVIDITDQLSNFLIDLEDSLIGSYAEIHYGWLDTASQADRNDLPRENSSYFQRQKNLIADVDRRIRELRPLKDENYEAYMLELYDLCAAYHKIDEKYQNMVTDIEILGEELEYNEGSLETNFNYDENAYYWKVVQGEIDWQTQPYTGPTNEELGIVQGSQFTHQPEYDYEIDEDDAVERADEADDFEPSAEIIERMNADETDENQEPADAIIYNMPELGTRAYLDVPESWFDCILDGGTIDDLSIDDDVLTGHLLSLNPILNYDEGRYLIDISEAEPSGEFPLLGNYFVSWIDPANNLSEYSVQDFTFSDTGKFEIFCINENYRNVHLKGYIFENSIIMTDECASAIIDLHNVPKATVYRHYK